MLSLAAHIGQFPLCSGCRRWMWASVFTLRARKRLLSLEVGADCQRRLSSLLWSQGFLDSTSATPSTAFPSSVLAVEVQPIWRLDAAELHLERLLSLPSPKESVRPQPHTRCVNGREVGLAAPLVCLPLIALLYPTEPLQRATTSCDTAEDSTLSQVRPAAGIVVALVCMKFVGPPARAALQSFDCRHGIYTWLKHHRVMPVSATDQDNQRDALGIYDDVSLGA